MKIIEGGSRKLITIQFAPLIPYNEAPNLVGREFYAYPIEFNLRLLFIENNEKMDLINDYFICNISYQNLDKLIETIKPI